MTGADRDLAIVALLSVVAVILVVVSVAALIESPLGLLIAIFAFFVFIELVLAVARSSDLRALSLPPPPGAFMDPESA